MTDDQTLKMRIGQLEESRLEQGAANRELRTEVEALGDALVMMTAALEASHPGSLVPRLNKAAEAQRELQNERAATAIEMLIASAQAEG